MGRFVASLVVVVLLAGCSSRVETSAASRQLEAPTAAGESVAQTPEPPQAAATSEPASQEPPTASPGPAPQPESSDEASVVLYEGFEGIFAIHTATGEAIQVGRRLGGPSLPAIGEANVVDGYLYWSVAAKAVGDVDTSVVARTDLRIGETVRHIELSDISPEVPRRGYELLFASPQQLVVEYKNDAVDGPRSSFEVFETTTGSWQRSIEQPRLESADCAQDLRDFEVLRDDRVIARTATSTAFFDLDTGTSELIIGCGTTPVLAEFVDDPAVLSAASAVLGSLPASDVDIEPAGAIPLTPGSAIALGDDDLWWITQAAYPANDSATVHVAVLVRSDLASRTVEQIWPLGDYLVEGPLCAEPCHRSGELGAELAWVDGRLVMAHQEPDPRIHVLDPGSGDIAEIQPGARGGQVVRGLHLTQDQFGQTHVLALRGQPAAGPGSSLVDLSVLDIDVIDLTLVDEVHVGQLRALESTAVADFPRPDPRRVWSTARDLVDGEIVLGVPSNAMAPTIAVGDGIILAPGSQRPEAGDIVTFAKPLGTDGDNDLVKRIVATGGQLVEFRDNLLIVDGLVVDEPYLLEQSSTHPRLTIPFCAEDELSASRCLLPPETFFMMGDNRLGSSDSRVFGPVAADTITGLVVEIIRSDG